MFGLNRPWKNESSGSLSSIPDIFHIFVNAKCSGLYWPPYLLTTDRIYSNYTVWGYISILWPISLIAQRINRKKSASSIVSISIILKSYWPTLLQVLAIFLSWYKKGRIGRLMLTTLELRESRIFLHWKCKSPSFDSGIDNHRSRGHDLCIRFFKKIRSFTLSDLRSDIRSQSSIRPIFKCRCPPLAHPWCC